MKIICCTMFSPSHEELAEVSLVNLIEYTKIHGYGMRIIYIENDKWEYKKHEAFVKFFEEGYDLIWYKDVDSIITNLTIPVTDFVDDEHDFFITRDFTELNGGSIIIKNTNNGKWVNDEILRMRNEFQNEQNVINSLYTQPVFRKKVKTLSHPSINSYLYENYVEIGKLLKDEGQWEEGCFVLHVPALPMEQRIKILKQAKITR